MHNRSRVTLLVEAPAGLSDGQLESMTHLCVPVTQGVFLMGGEKSTLCVGVCVCVSLMIDQTISHGFASQRVWTSAQTHTWSDFISASLLCTQPIIAESCGLIQIKIRKCSPKN